MKVIQMSHSGVYKYFSQKPSPKIGKDGIYQGEAERRQKLVRTIESYELGIVEDGKQNNTANGNDSSRYRLQIQKEKENTIILLGRAIRKVNRSKGNQKLIWLKRLFGPQCLSVVSGEVGKTPDVKYRDDKGEKVSDYIHYSLVRLKDNHEMLKSLKDCQYHYLMNEHLNLMPLLTFLVSTPEKCPSPEKRSNLQQKKNPNKQSLMSFSPSCDLQMQENTNGANRLIKKAHEKMSKRKKREQPLSQSQSSSKKSFSAENIVGEPSKKKIRAKNMGSL